jgi:hypothetical protein
MNAAMNKRLIYTCLTADHDQLRDPTEKPRGWDMVCFTDHPERLRHLHLWRIEPLPAMNLSQRMQNRYVKLRLFDFFPVTRYAWALWIDASFQLCGDLNNAWRSRDAVGRADLYAFSHPYKIQDFHQEGNLIIQSEKAPTEAVKEQCRYYRQQGVMRRSYHQIAAGLMLYKIRETYLREALRCWYGQLERFTPRDQLAFQYVMHNYPMRLAYLNWEHWIGTVLNYHRHKNHPQFETKPLKDGQKL